MADPQGRRPAGVTSMGTSAASVIVVVRNGARFLAEALDSIRQSTVAPAEILVVDGGSTDGTFEIVCARPQLTLVRQRSRGIANAYNEAIERAASDVVAFLSHDDLWLPNKLERHLTLMSEQPELLYTTSLVQHFLEPGCTPPPGFRREMLDAPVHGVIMEALVARKAAFAAAGPFDPRFPVGEDTDWFARAVDAGLATAVIPEVLVRKRVHTTNASLNEANLNAHLLTALRGSVARKRATQP
jgi:glycosyltransferase involved in cell wall biosynthesis